MDNRFSLAGKVAVVTGANGTFGSEFCRTFAEAGADIVASWEMEKSMKPKHPRQGLLGFKKDPNHFHFLTALLLHSKMKKCQNREHQAEML